MTLREYLRWLLSGARPAAECPLPACQTCIPTIQAIWDRPLAVADYRHHRYAMACMPSQVVWWLTESWPEAWWESTDINDVAERLLAVRTRLLLRRLVP